MIANGPINLTKDDVGQIDGNGSANLIEQRVPQGPSKDRHVIAIE